MATSLRSKAAAKMSRKRSRRSKALPVDPQRPSLSTGKQLHARSRKTLADVVQAAAEGKLAANTKYQTDIGPNVAAVLDRIGVSSKVIAPKAVEGLLEYVSVLLQQPKTLDPLRFPFRTFEVFAVALLFASQPRYYSQYVRVAKSRQGYPGGVAELISEYKAIFESPEEMLILCRGMCMLNESAPKPGKSTLIEEWIIMAYMMDRHREALYEVHPEYSRLPVIRGMVTVLINMYQGIATELSDPGFQSEELRTGWDSDEISDVDDQQKSVNNRSIFSNGMRRSNRQRQILLGDAVVDENAPKQSDPYSPRAGSGRALRQRNGAFNVRNSLQRSSASENF